jgi:hypothetical protein
MTSSLIETTIGAFEERMALRRKMLNVTGVRLSKRRLSQDVEDKIRDSIINCYECKSGDTCTSWLAAVADEVPPPEFCPNRDTILRLKADGYSKVPVK